MLFTSIHELAANPEHYVLHPGKDFSRNRKLGFQRLLLMLLTMEGDCIKEELYRYFGRSTDTPSKAAFYKQRKKVKEDAFRSLLVSFTQKYQKKLLKGKYSLVACDGSAADIFRNPDDSDTFFEPNGKSTRGFNQIHINAFFSVLDKKFTDLLIQPARKRNEYSAFCQMVDRSESDTPVIYLCDRGYASYNAFAHVIESGQFFVMRCTDDKTEKILGFPLDNIQQLDYHVERILSRSQSKKKRFHPEQEEQYRFVCKNVPMDYITQGHPEYRLSLRIIRIELSDSCYENLITNLPELDFDFDDLKDLYHLRWDEETSFRDLKYPLCLKAFHSQKYEYIIQEVWARAILYNFCSEIAMAVEIPEKKRKYVYQVNYSEAIKICRDFLRIHDGTTLDVEGLIAQNILPVRPGRTFPRQARFKLPISFCYRN
ncbi:MAG: IS4 family transposase [Coprococcus phoceensis]